MQAEEKGIHFFVGVVAFHCLNSSVGLAVSCYDRVFGQFLLLRSFIYFRLVLEADEWITNVITIFALVVYRSALFLQFV